MLVLVVALFALVSGQAGGNDAVAQCVSRIDSLSIATELPKAQIPALINKYCRSQRWLNNLYETNREFYDAWVAREQVRFILDDVLATVSLRECFRTWAASEFKGNADVNARIALDVLAEINGYMTIPTPTERALGACRVWRGYLKAGATNVPNPAAVGISAVVQREAQAAVKADTNDICTLTGEQAVPELFAFVEKAVRDALKQANVPQLFLDSQAFSQCEGNGRVGRDINSFARIEKLYCLDEEIAYETGGPDRRAASERAVRDGWALECPNNPNYFPDEIAAARARQ